MVLRVGLKHSAKGGPGQALAMVVDNRCLEFFVATLLFHPKQVQENPKSWVKQQLNMVGLEDKVGQVAKEVHWVELG